MRENWGRSVSATMRRNPLLLLAKQNGRRWELGTVTADFELWRQSEHSISSTGLLRQLFGLSLLALLRCFVFSFVSCCYWFVCLYVFTHRLSKSAPFFVVVFSPFLFPYNYLFSFNLNNVRCLFQSLRNVCLETGS